MSSASLINLQNKLKSEWSANNVLLSLQLLPELTASFNDLEKHTKIRVLVSFILMDQGKRNEYKSIIESICVKACGDKDTWVQVMSEIVMQRIHLELFPNMETQIDKVAEQCIENYKTAVEGRDIMSSAYFAPLEYMFLRPSLLPHQESSFKDMNHHFTSNYDMPQFIPLDLLQSVEEEINQATTVEGITDGGAHQIQIDQSNKKRKDAPTTNISGKIDEKLSSQQEPLNKQVSSSLFLSSPAAAVTTQARVPIDIQELYSEFPEISSEDKKKIEDFESLHWMDVCPKAGTERIKLVESNKLNLLGESVRETIYLVLTYDTRTWKKIKKSKQNK